MAAAATASPGRQPTSATTAAGWGWGAGAGSSHCLGSGSAALVPYRGATWQAAVLNPRLLPSRSFAFVSHRTGAPAPRAFSVEIEQRWDPRRRQDGTGACVWDASVALSDRLCARPELVEGRAVVELGAGCGLLAIVAALLGARCVHATDLPQALLLLARNVWLNSAAPGQRAAGPPHGGGGDGVHVGCCNWGDVSHARRIQQACPAGHVDLILGSDLVYQLKETSQESLDRVAKLGRADDSAACALLTTICALATPGHTRILFLGRFRVKADTEFLSMAEEKGFRVNMSDAQGREGTADYQLIELGWPAATVPPPVHGTAGSCANGRGGPASDAGAGAGDGCEEGGLFVLRAEAFGQLQQALSSASSAALDID